MTKMTFDQIFSSAQAGLAHRGQNKNYSVPFSDRAPPRKGFFVQRYQKCTERLVWFLRSS